MQALQSEAPWAGSNTGSVMTGTPTVGFTLYLWGPCEERGTESFLKSILGIKTYDSKKDLVIVFYFSQRNLNPRV